MPIVVTHDKIIPSGGDGNPDHVQNDDWLANHVVAIGAGSIATADIADAAVTSAKIATSAVTSAKLATNAVTNTVLAQMAANTISGNNTGSTANRVDMTVAQARAMLGGNLIGIQRFSASGTWTPTAGTVTVMWEFVAGGGGGGGVATNGAGAGGNSGFYGEHHVTNGAGFSAGAVTIGAGGAGGANTGATGSTGGDTSIVVNGTTFTVKGGTGGGGVNNLTATTTIATNAASGSTAGMDVLRFGTGMPGVIFSSAPVSGAGGHSPFGSPGQPVNSAIGTGKAGTFGAGGSGAAGSASSAVGGAGGDGLVIVYEFS